VACKNCLLQNNQISAQHFFFYSLKKYSLIIIAANNNSDSSPTKRIDNSAMAHPNSFFRRRSSGSAPSNDPLDGRRSQRKLLLEMEDPSLTASDNSSSVSPREERTILYNTAAAVQQGGPGSGSSCGNHTVSQHSATTTTIKNNTKRVRFSTVQVREFPIGIGDNPAVSRGVPIAIEGWKIYDGGDYCFPLEELEQQQEQHPCPRGGDGPRRGTLLQLQMGSLDRIRMLKEMGYSRCEINHATQNVNVARAQRQRTVQTLKWAGVQEGMERIQRSLLNATLRRTAKQRERIFLAPYRSSGTWTTTSQNEIKKNDTNSTIKAEMDMSLSQHLSIIDMTGQVRSGVPTGTVGD
jgi:hypothetical protein